MKIYVKPRVEMERFVLDAEYASGIPQLSVGKDAFDAEVREFIEQLLNGQADEWADLALQYNEGDDFEFSDRNTFLSALGNPENENYGHAKSVVDNFIAMSRYGGANIRDGGCYYGFYGTDNAS